MLGKTFLSSVCKSAEIILMGLSNPNAPDYHFALYGSESFVSYSRVTSVGWKSMTNYTLDFVPSVCETPDWSLSDNQAVQR